MIVTLILQYLQHTTGQFYAVKYTALETGLFSYSFYYILNDIYQALTRFLDIIMRNHTDVHVSVYDQVFNVWFI